MPVLIRQRRRCFTNPTRSQLSAIKFEHGCWLCDPERQSSNQFLWEYLARLDCRKPADLEDGYSTSPYNATEPPVEPVTNHSLLCCPQSNPCHDVFLELNLRAGHGRSSFSSICMTKSLPWCVQDRIGSRSDASNVTYNVNGAWYVTPGTWNRWKPRLWVEVSVIMLDRFWATYWSASPANGTMRTWGTSEWQPPLFL